MDDDFPIYMKHKIELDRFESFYFESRKKGYKTNDLDQKIKLLEKLIQETKTFEAFCKSVGLSRYVKEMYKEAHNSKRPKFNLFKDDKDELRRCKRLKIVLRKINSLTLDKLNKVEKFINEIT